VQGAGASAGASGQGGQGTPDGSGNNGSGGPEEATVFDPQDATGPTDEVNADPNRSDGESETVGKSNTTSSSSGGAVPLSQALPKYQQRATAAVDQMQIPPSLRALVKAYFQRMAERAG
jgi:hypothetical protein